MEAKIVKCYLCNAEAEQEEGFDTSRSIRIICQQCKKYLLTHKALFFFFLRKDGKVILNADDKKKLSEYVKKNYNPEKDEAVPISTDIITAVTGKQSINTRYE